MNNGHTAINEFLSDRRRFADFLNGNLFQGEQIVLPEDLEIIKGESDVLVENKGESPDKVRRYRDIVMRWKREMKFVILACENQRKVHYAMPIRTMLYDSLSYVEQAKQLWEKSQDEERSKPSEEEYLSRFRKGDCLFPVITIVFYYGTQVWDGSTDLYGMFEQEEVLKNEFMEKYVPNYWINLIDVEHIKDINVFQTELKEIFGMMKLRNDKTALAEYMKDQGDFFQHVDKQTYYAISELLHSKKMLKEVKTEEGEIDMCKALEDLYQDGIDSGIKQGIKQGIEQGETRLGLLIAKLLEDGRIDVVSLVSVNQESREKYYGQYNI